MTLGAVYRAVHFAKKDGTLVSQPCEVCGDERVHAHHDDYAKPLEVRWLCPTHHRRHHIEHGPGLNMPATPISPYLERLDREFAAYWQRYEREFEASLTGVVGL